MHWSGFQYEKAAAPTLRSINAFFSLFLFKYSILTNTRRHFGVVVVRACVLQVTQSGLICAECSCQMLQYCGFALLLILFFPSESYIRVRVQAAMPSTSKCKNKRLVQQHFHVQNRAGALDTTKIICS